MMGSLAKHSQKVYSGAQRETDRLRKQQGIAERIATGICAAIGGGDWQFYFDIALREIQQFDSEFEVSR